MATRPHLESENKTTYYTRWLGLSNPQLRQIIDCLIHCRTLLLLLLAACMVIFLGLFNTILSSPSESYFIPLQGFLLFASLTLIIASLRLMWRDYLKPILNLHNWTLYMRGGNLSARILVPKSGELAEVVPHLNSLGDMLQSLARDTEQQLQRHTEHIAQKTRSLSILYDVAASINVSRDLNDLLKRFLHTLTEVVGTHAAAVRLLTKDGQMKLVASKGLDQEMIQKERVLPAESCLCGQLLEGGSVRFQDTLLPCWKSVRKDYFDGKKLSMLVVPLQYREHTLGVYNLFVNKKTFQRREDMLEVCTSIGRHLGMAIEKARLDDEANRHSIMNERTRIAHELHDSLAQTLASIRFQVRVLDEMLHQGDEAAIWEELERIENSVDEAHTELRELIAHFRAPIAKQGLIPSIEQAVERFRVACNDVHIFLQKEWPNRPLPAEYETQVLRIIQEALANVRKHAQANTVRVLLQGDEKGNYRVLIEDDGVGLGYDSPTSTLGEHVGLSIIKDRARRIGGELRIECEPGEGVQIMLTFRHPDCEEPRFDVQNLLNTPVSEDES